MKIPGMFSKAPKYHRFEYKPRYFDPKKEEFEEREKRLREELEKEGRVKGESSSLDMTDTSTYDYRARMTGAFQEARRRSKSQNEPNLAVIRLGIMLCIVLFLVAFLTWGSKAVYGLFAVFPVWIYIRFFKNRSNS